MEKYITFSLQIKKECDNGKKMHINLGLLILLDLCQVHYQNLLIVCLEFLIL